MDFFVQYHITNKCNLKCTHCYQGEHSNKDKLSKNDIFKSISELYMIMQGWRLKHDNNLTYSIQITGGEPLLRDDWKDIAIYAKEKKFDITLLTNGTLIDHTNADIIKKNNIKIQISLDGTQKTNDKIRGKNSFSRTIRSIEILKSYNIDTYINITIMRSNLMNLPNLIMYLQSHNIKGIGLTRYVPNINDAASYTNMLSQEELRNFYLYIRKTNKSVNNIYCDDPLYNTINKDTSKSPVNFHSCIQGCSAGFYGITIQSDGTIVPCSRLNIPLGNIKNSSIREIWATSDILWNLRRFENYNDNCKKCNYLRICRGCRAVAHTSKRDYLAPDPQCWHK